jgi:hypothetical protein
MMVTLEGMQGWFIPQPTLARGEEPGQRLWGVEALAEEAQPGVVQVGYASQLPEGTEGRSLLLVMDVPQRTEGNEALCFPAGTDPEAVRRQAELGFADCFRRTEQEQRVLRAGLDGDLASLVQAGAEALGRPVLLGDAILTVLASWGQPKGAGESWEAFIRSGYAPDFQWDASPFAENSFPLDDQFVACRIENQTMGWDDLLIDLGLENGGAAGKCLGHLVISGQSGPFCPGEYGVIAALCHGIRGELRRRQEDRDLQRVTGEEFLAQLLRGELRGEMLNFRASLLHQPLEGSFALAVVGLEDYHPRRSSISTVRKELGAVCGGPSALVDNQLVQLILRPQCRTEAERVLAENGLRGGLSRPFPHLEDVPRFYRQAARALEVLPHLESAGPLAEYGDVELDILLRQLPREVLEELAHHPLALRLTELDRESKFSFTETLTAYLECAQRPALACQRLHIHRNTLDYRLRRMEECTALRWERGEELTVVYLALRAQRFLERKLSKELHSAAAAMPQNFRVPSLDTVDL